MMNGDNKSKSLSIFIMRYYPVAFLKNDIKVMRIIFNNIFMIFIHLIFKYENEKILSNSIFENLMTKVYEFIYLVFFWVFDRVFDYEIM